MNKRNLLLVALVVSCAVVVICVSGCLKNSENTNTCTYDPCSYVAPAAEIQAVQAYITANNITASQHCSGLFYKIDQPGTGNSATACSYVDVTYTGKLTNGTTFDSTSTPVTFSLSQLIRGWVNGIPLIKEGGSINLYVPPSLGYGNQVVGTIPANSVLVFKVNLVTVRS